MGVIRNHSHFIRLSILPIDMKWGLWSPFHILGTLEAQNRTHEEKVLGTLVGVFSCAIHLLLPVINRLAYTINDNQI